MQRANNLAFTVDPLIFTQCLVAEGLKIVLVCIAMRTLCIAQDDCIHARGQGIQAVLALVELEQHYIIIVFCEHRHNSGGEGLIFWLTIEAWEVDIDQRAYFDGFGNRSNDMFAGQQQPRVEIDRKCRARNGAVRSAHLCRAVFNLLQAAIFGLWFSYHRWCPSST